MFDIRLKWAITEFLLHTVLRSLSLIEGNFKELGQAITSTRVIYPDHADVRQNAVKKAQ